MDNLTPEKRSHIMASIKGKNTRPELILRKLLWHGGYRYRLHYKKLPGRPDIVFPGRKKVIFAHGCFWHKHDCDLFHWPRTREEFWKEKIFTNVSHDKKNQKELNRQGWEFLVLWECEIKKKDQELLWQKLVDFLG